MHTYLPKDLDFFVMLSSASGYIGTPKLSSYVAGNTYNDGLAQYRRSLGLKACALGYGFIVGAVPTPAQVATTVGTGGELRLTKLIKTRDWFNDPNFHFLAKLDVRHDIIAAQSGGNADIKAALEQAPSIAHAADVVESALASKLALSMSMSAEDIDSSKPVSSYGVDSLVSMEIRNWVESTSKSNTGVFEILSSGPIATLATKIAENSLLVREEAKVAAGVVGASA